MSRVVLTGISGANPLEFLAAVGLLRVASHESPGARLSFQPGGTYHPVIEGAGAALERLVATDAASAESEQGWRLQYEKVEKRGTKIVADLKAPPAVFQTYLRRSIDAWSAGRSEGAEFAAAYATSVAVDGRGNTKPSAFHFTAANQQFLGTIEDIRSKVDQDWARASLFEGGAARAGANVRWDPAADRNYALMAEDPNAEGTTVDAPMEWLAFRALPFFPTLPRGARVETTAVSGRGDSMRFSWPLWETGATSDAVRTVISLPMVGRGVNNLRALGIFATCSSEIRRTSQGFGNFGPATVEQTRRSVVSVPSR